MNLSPVPEKKEVQEPQPYKIEFNFNEKAQLVHVEAPEWMSRPLLIGHLAVASQYIAQVIDKREGL